MPNLLAFLSYVVMTTFTPGPNNIMAMSNATRYGFRSSARFRIGACLGFFGVIALAIAFTAALHGAMPTIKPLMTFIGAAYILWLAYKTATSSPHGKDSAAQNTFLAGMLLQFLNPKGILFAVTIAAVFIVPYYDSSAALVGFAAALALVGLTAMTCWALFGSVFERFMTRNHRLVNYVMGALLVYCAVSLFV